MGGTGLPKLFVCVSQSSQKPLAENTHSSMRARSQSIHTRQLSERLGRVLLISFSADTSDHLCMLSQLFLLLSWYSKAGGVFASIGVSRSEQFTETPGVFVHFLPATLLICKPQRPTNCNTLLKNCCVAQQFLQGRNKEIKALIVI